MHKLPRAVLDANVFISAILYHGIPSQVLNLWRLEGKFALILSPETLAQVIGKLKSKFNFPDNLLEEWENLLQENIIPVLPEHKIKICRDPRDDIVIATAVSGKANYLVTGDKDLLILKKYFGIKIITPTEFLNILQGV